MLLHQRVFYIALYLSYILYFIAYFKLGNYNPKYLVVLDMYMKYYVTIFLLIRFNPFVKIQFTEFDRKVVFSSAILLLTTTILTQYSKQIELIEILKRTISR